MEKTEQLPESLLKYDPPVVVELLTTTKKLKTTQAPVQINPQQGLVDFLDSIFPPKRFNDGGLDYIQHASVTPASRSDVINLEEQLDALLKQRKARATGICAIRTELFEDCFNEIIREVAIDSNERASLLISIRDEIKESINGYEKQYESTISHGIRKAIHGEQNKNALKAENDALEAEIRSFEERIEDLKRRMSEAEANDAADAAAKGQEHVEKMAMLRAENAAIRQKLEALLVSPPTSEEPDNKKKK